jgi:superfamily I DNA/RNA helicase/RecB family exonuclease
MSEAGGCIGVVTPQPSAPHLAELSTEQAAVLAQWTAPTLVLGGPGTGKTTLLGRAAVSQIRAGGAPPVVLVTGRAAASRLRNAITAELGPGVWNPQVTTVHALSRSLWQRFSGRPEVRLLAAPEQEFRVRELLAGAGPARWPDALQLAAGTRGFAVQVRAAIARARQLGLEPADLILRGAEAGREEWSALGRFFAEYLDVLDAEGVLDYAELVHRVRLLLAEPDVSAVVGAEIGSVLVDDYAELDSSQLGVIAALAPGAAFLAAADPDSVTATFRGADPRAVRDFEVLFGAPGRAVQVVRLEHGYRYGAQLGAALAGVRSRLPRLPGLGAGATDNLGASGEVSVLSCADEADQARGITAELRRARTEQGLAYGQMAVLVRSGRQLGPVTRALLSAGIPIEVAADEIPLAQAPAVRSLLLALAVAAAGTARPDEATRLLTSPLGGFDAVSLRALVRQWRGHGHADAAHLPLATQLAELLNDSSWAVGEQLPTQTVRLAGLASLLAGARTLLAESAPVDVVIWHLWRGTDWPAQLSKESAQAGTNAGRADADLDALCALFETASQADRRGGQAGVRAFLAELEAQQIPADRERESRLRHRGVQVLTAHRSRGLEWDLVVVAGVQEGSWPAGRRLSAVLDAAELTADGLAGGTDAREALAAERRLFHLACSRARSRLVVTATSGIEGEGDAPSRFLAELGVAARRRAPTSTPVTLPALVAQLRRFSASPTVGEPLRTAAALELARLADIADEGGRALVPQANPETWWGVRELSSRPVPSDAVVRLSPSQVNAALTCPRRYFLSRQAGGEGEMSLAAALGSLIHRLVQLVVDEGWGLAQLGDQLDQVWHRLPFDAAWFSASERAEVERALARFMNWRAGRDAELVAVEAPFTMELALDGIQIIVSGQVDWLERTPNGLGVADFKTSPRQPTAEEVASMEQLGIYQLAITEGAFAGLPQAAQAISVGASAVYLRQGSRPDDLPKQFWQPALSERPQLGVDDDAAVYPTWVHQRVAAAARVVAEGRYPATAGSHCSQCAFASSCPAIERGRQVLG